MITEDLDKFIEALKGNPDYVVKEYLKTKSLFFKMVLMKVCNGETNMRKMYPELYI